MRFLVLLALMGLAEAGSVQHKLTWHQSRRMRMAMKGELQEYLKYKENLRTTNLASAQQTALDYDDTEYIGNVTVGTPDQRFGVILDTGSSNFYIPSVICDYSCGGKRRFLPAKSSTFQNNGSKEWTIYNGEEGVCRGTFGVDVVKLGATGRDQLVIPKTTVGIATHLSDDFGDSPADGILGLAFTSLAVDHVVPPVINAINQGLLDQPLFTVWLEHKGRVSGASGGVITYGAIDTTNCGPVIAYQPLSSATYYEFKINGVGLGSYKSTASSYTAISNTGSSLIGGIQSVTDKIAQAAGAKWHAIQQLYYLDCNANFAPFTVDIGSNTYSIDPVNLIVNLGNNKCILAIYPFSAAGFGYNWILGDPFIRQYCNIHDIGNKRIGFAPSLQK